MNVAKKTLRPHGRDHALTFIKKYMRFRNFEAGEAFS